MARKIKCRIALAVDPTGEWNACGWGQDGKPAKPDDYLMGMAVDTLSAGERRYYVTVEVEVPEATEVEGEVTDG